MISELNPHAAWVIGLIGLALVLFAMERIRLQATALLTFVILLASFSLFPYELSDGSVFQAQSLLEVFGNHALVTVCALMILGKGIETTQALQPLVASVSRHWPERPKSTMLFILLGAALFSAFLNNTPIVVIMLPVLLTVAQKNKVSASKLLLPLGLVTIIGGMSTTIGTSTNLLVVDLAEDIAGLHVGIFDLLPYFLFAGLIGILYLWLVAPVITPQRELQNSAVSEEAESRKYIATMVIDSRSDLDGKSVANLLNMVDHAIAVERIKHEESTFRLPLPTVVLHSGDHVYVRGTVAALKEAELALGTKLHTLESGRTDDPEMDPIIQEILVTERSRLDGVSLRRSRLVEDYGIVGIAIHRTEQAQARSKLPLNRIRLRAGDILLCEGTRQQFEKLLAETRLLALTEQSEVRFTHRSTIALTIIAAVVVVAALEILPISISALAGVGLMRATKCVAWRHIGQALSTQVILVIAVSLALGQALMATGGDAYIASLLAEVFGRYSAEYVIPGLMLLTALLTNIVSNNAAAVIGTPIGIQLASQLGIPVEPMILAVLFGANLSFATPIGYQTNLLVFTAGGYKFSDFVRVGLPLTLIMWACLSITLVTMFL